MDFSGIDRLIEVLEKASTRPGSNPVLVDGKLGIWRTIRGFRMFIVLDGPFKDTVLVGPPAFAGKKLNDVGEKGWEALTPRATNKKFAKMKADKDGIKNLKNAIRDAIGPEDTRHDRLRQVNTVEELVPLARSAGFSDDEIEASLKGKDVTRELRRARGIPDVRPKEKPVRDVERRKKPIKLEVEPATTEPSQEFQGIIDAFNTPSASQVSRLEAIADSIIAMAKRQKDPDVRMRLEHIGFSLKAGTMSLTAARERIDDLMNPSGPEMPKPSVSEVNVAHDRQLLQGAIDDMEVRLSEKMKEFFREAAGNSDKAKDLAFEELLDELIGQVRAPQVKQEVTKVQQAVKSGRMNHRTGVLRLLQILRLILSLIPS